MKETGSVFTHLKDNMSEEEKKYLEIHPDKIPANLKGPEDKVYMVSICSREEDELPSQVIDGYLGVKYNYETILCVGRSNALEYIREYIENDFCTAIDIENSFVLVDGVSFDKRITLHRFIEYCNSKYQDKKLDISLYINSEEQDTEKQSATGLGNGAGTLLNN